MAELKYPIKSFYTALILDALCPQLYQSLISCIVQDNGKSLAELLTKTGADVNFSFKRSQRSLLHVAAGV